jgi:hypothetical protein
VSLQYSSREHRADLKQGMLAFAMTRHGEVPRYLQNLQTLDGNASDQVSLVAAVEAVAAHLHRSTARPRDRREADLRGR